MKMQLDVVHFQGTKEMHMALFEVSVSSSCLDRRTRPIEQMAVSDYGQLSRMIKSLRGLIIFDLRAIEAVLCLTKCT